MLQRDTIASPKSVIHRITLPLALATLMVAAFWLRVAPGWEFYAPSSGHGVVLPETDPYFHFRQASYTMEHYPSLMRVDSGSHYPAVERNDAVGLYDLLLASLGRLVAWATGLGNARALQWVCLLLPPLFGAILPVFVFDLVRRRATDSVAVTMALWSVLLPGDGLFRTSLGFCDNHMVEMLLSLLCIRGLIRLTGSPTAIRLPWWRPAWGAALPLAVFLFTWLGAPLYLPIMVLTFGGQLMADVLSGRPARDTAHAALRYWLAFFVLATAAGLLWPSLIMRVDLWRTSCAGALLAAAAFAAAGWYFDRTGFPRRPVIRIGIAAVVTVGCLLSLIAVLVRMVPSLHGLIFGIREHKSTLVSENMPVTMAGYWVLTGLAGVLALAAPAIGVITGAIKRPGWWLSLLPGLLILSLWCWSYDYAYLGALHAVILCGLVWGARSERRERWLGPGVIAATTGVIAVCAFAGWTLYPGMLQSWYAGPVQIATPAWQQATAWLAQQPAAAPNTPAGVLTDWPHGNLINALARLPTVSSRYPEPEGLRPLFLETEDAVRSAPLRGSTVAQAVRYVVLSPLCLAEYLPGYLTECGLAPAAFTEIRRCLNDDGDIRSRPYMNARYSRLFASQLLLTHGDGLSHFRLVFESDEPMFYRLVNEPATRTFGPQTTNLPTTALRKHAANTLALRFWKEDGKDAYDGRILPSVSIFEQVAGARLTGYTRPGAMVTASLNLVAASADGHHRFTHRVTTLAGPDGHFTLIVPYATNGLPQAASVRPDGLWTVTCDGVSHTWAVDEVVVKNGGTLSLANASFGHFYPD